jgi:hypothetical protein
MTQDAFVANHPMTKFLERIDMIAAQNHYKIIVSTSHRADGSRLGFRKQYLRTRGAVQMAVIRFGSASWHRGEGGVYTSTSGRIRMCRNLVFDIGVTTNYEHRSVELQVLEFCEYLRVLFEQKQVYMVSPQMVGTLFEGKGRKV